MINPGRRSLLTAALLLFVASTIIVVANRVVRASGAGSCDARAFRGPDPRAAVAKFVGCELADNGDFAVTSSRAEALARQMPRGARIDRAQRTLTFSGTNLHLVVVASPPNADMKFEIAGMVDPTIIVRKGVRVDVEFINADDDEAHMWVLVPTATRPRGYEADASGAAARPLGDPGREGYQAETISFELDHLGTYEYLCGFPGHSEQGMHGRLLVRNQ